MRDFKVGSGFDNKFDFMTGGLEIKIAILVEF